MIYLKPLRRKINVWLITYSLLLVSFTVFALSLAHFVDKKIKEHNLLPVQDIPKFSHFDNKLDLETFTIKAIDYNEIIRLSGFVIDTTNPEKALLQLRLPYQYYKVIKIPQEIIFTTTFGTYQAVIIEMSDEVINDYVYVIAEFDNQELNLLKGISVTSSIVYQIRYNAIVIPKTYVYNLENSHYVYKVNASNTDYKMARIEIMYELQFEGLYVISGEIYEGDIIVKLR